ncbi:hypothetical protein E8L99_10050 [Phreatobacter aquaticus]|uniref:Uncharacterized protein n=1 Tax=Phreatobacter aquaticus TaxID=2570229 RepID=A0A4D7QH84_9HYPH|nr:hypothetical protein [Phreatobacter aquaticus]QCK86071.1 hypothetical protein E8L99_10050 [Phreatobacter aquaticus]
MERIEQLAFEWAAREAGLTAFGVVVCMLVYGASIDQALKIGALGFTLVAAFQLLRARQIVARAPETTEIWANLRSDERPPRAVAQRLIARAGTQASCRFGLHAARLSLCLWAFEIGGAMIGLPA